MGFSQKRLIFRRFIRFARLAPHCYHSNMATHGNGILIAVEGIDGAGKTTLVARLAESLSLAGEPVTCSKEPTNGPWGQKIRESVTNGRMPLDEELQTFIEDRRWHVEKLIAPALARGETVIVDRYFYSTIAYQGVRGADVDQLANGMRSEFPIPDVTILVDVTPEVGLFRISQSRGETPNNFEQADALSGIRSIFLGMVDRMPEVALINGLGSPDEVYFESAHLLLNGVLKAKRCAKGYDCDIFYCSYRSNGECKWADIYRRMPASSVVG